MGNFNWRYTNAKRQTYKGNSYRSKAEVNYAMYLDQRVKDKEIKSWEREKKIELFGENGTKICNYYIDFVVHHNDGSTEYVEVKGFKTNIWLLKKKLMEDKVKGMENTKYTVEYV